jgi:hypothetical protein
MYPCLKFLVQKGFCFQCVDDGGGGGGEGFLELPVILVELVEHARETFD